MPIPPARPPAVRRSVETFTPGGGRARTPSTSAATQNVSYVGPTQIIGTDSAAFTATLRGGIGTVTVGFPNLPTRNNQLTSLQPQLKSSHSANVQPKDALLFYTTLQESDAPSGTVISVKPQALDSSGVTAPGPNLGSRTFRAFSAVVTVRGAGTGTVHGTVVGQLLLSIG